MILDVVYKHTAEGNHLGPTICMRGIDNAAYYRLVDDDQRYCMDYTGSSPAGNGVIVVHDHSWHRDMARTLGFEGHIAWAEAMP